MTIRQIKAHYKPGPSRHWFDADTIGFFKTRFHGLTYTTPNDGTMVYFVTSEQPPEGVRKFSVRAYDKQTRQINTVGEFWSDETEAAAHERARFLAGVK